MYVISAKKKKYNSNEFEWQYFQYDNGAYGSGYPIFSDFHGAKQFATPESAKKEFEEMKKYITKDILPETLAVRKVNIQFKYVERLALDTTYSDTY